MRTRIVAASALALTLLLATSARAELHHVEIKTLGMDWEICAHAVRVAMQKIEGIQTARVSLKDGLTILDLIPGNGVTVSKLRQIIKNNGFVSKEAVVLASGRPEGTATFVVSGTNESLTVSSAPRQTEREWRLSIAAPRP